MPEKQWAACLCLCLVHTKDAKHTKSKTNAMQETPCAKHLPQVQQAAVGALQQDVAQQPCLHPDPPKSQYKPQQKFICSPTAAFYICEDTSPPDFPRISFHSPSHFLPFAEL